MDVQAKEQKFHLKTLIDYFVAFSTIISMLLVLFTLNEMRTQRDNTYMPDVVVETKQMFVYWGVKSPYIVDDPSLPIEDNTKITHIKMELLNIGVGTAKEIKFTLNNEGIEKWITLLKEKNPKKEYSYNDEEGIINLNIDGRKIGFGKDYKFEKLFLLPNANESFSFYLPLIYPILIQKLYESYVTIPEIPITIEYSDVQGKQYKKNASLLIESLLLSADSEGNGFAQYNIVIE